MKGSLDSFAARLERELDAGSVSVEPATLKHYAVDDKAPSLVCVPGETAQLSAALRIASEMEAAVIPWGGGTSMKLGNPPHRFDAALALNRLNELIEHDDANLTATLQAGMELATVQERLGHKGQFLALDPPQPARATVGGLVAANTNGPRRMMYGAVRDQLIGIKMVLADGTSIKAGGKVVKNVAGYDLCKLFVGSLGTLGIITEATFKMAPLPERSATVLAQGPVGECLEFVSQLLRSTLLPAEIAILNSGALKATATITDAAAVAIWTEGFAEGVERHLRDLRRMAEAARLAAEIIRDHSHRLLWEKIRDFGAGEDLVAHRITVPLAAVAQVLTMTERKDFLAAPPAAVAFPGTGTIRLSTPADMATPADFGRLISLTKEHGGHVVMVAAPPEIKGAIDVWGPPPPTLPWRPMIGALPG
ncbi:MAG: FAD-binding oxidoreductase [Deltaproteobacteria bacterium]|nr:FAD-binding oxidoreductase [Deltaproteobacteria bacterium]